MRYTDTTIATIPSTSRTAFTRRMPFTSYNFHATPQPRPRLDPCGMIET